MATNPPRTYQDFISTFQDGVNSGVAALLLPKTQAAYGINATFRGGYATHRPPYIKLSLTFPSKAIETAVTTGFFQGAGWYRPDFGPLQIVAQISGRLFTFTKGSTAGAYTVAEITVPGDPNDATTSQVWMWQSEKWLIVTDGSAKLPIFYDGVTSRRSYGPAVVLGSVTAVSSAGPNAIGTVITATMAAVYSGPYDVPVLFNGAYYQPTQSGTGYGVSLENLFSPAGGTDSGALVARGDVIGKVKLVTLTSVPFMGISTGVMLITIGSKAISSGDKFVINGKLITIGFVGALVAGTRQVSFNYPNPPDISAPPGSLIYYATPISPSVLLGSVSSFTIPAVGSSVTVSLTLQYTLADGSLVWIGDDMYLASDAPPPAPSASLFLINLSDTAAIAGLPKDILSVPELPAGRMGAYGLCQNWMSLTDGISFIAGDVVGSAAGTQASDYRDAVLKTTGQTFFGGKFRLPGAGTIINSITFTANLDVSLGQGAVQLGTDSGIFSCLAPFDFANPPKSNIPILTQSLIGFGPLAQNSTVLANSDTLFRNFVGLGSLKLARRQFAGDEWGNTPISREMTRAYQQDNESLLPYGSTVVFDNRLLNTCSPQVSAQGVFHMGLVSLNFDLISSLRGKAPPIFDGLWSGLNALQVVNIQSGSEARAFIFGFNITDSRIELYELLKTEDKVYYDNGVTPIKWVIETPILFNKDVKPMEELVRLTNGELWVQDIVGTVHIKVQYRPDFYSGSQNPGCWVDWIEFDVCAEATGTNVRPGYRTRLGLGEPSGVPCEPSNNRPLRVGHFFQFRLEFTGTCKFMAGRMQAVTQPIADFAPPICTPICAEPALPELVIP